MEQSEIVDTLRDYLEREILRTPDSGLTAETPLLEWGVLNSLTMVRLVGFIHEEWGVRVPPEGIVGVNFRDLTSISRLVIELQSVKRGA